MTIVVLFKRMCLGATYLLATHSLTSWLWSIASIFMRMCIFVGMLVICNVGWLHIADAHDNL